MPMAMVCIAGMNRSDQLHDAMVFLSGVVKQADDTLDIRRDCGRALGAFMVLSMLVQTRTQRGILAVQGAMQALGGRPGSPCHGCQAMCMLAGEMEGDGRDPEVEIRVELMSRDEPGVLKPLAAFLAQKGLGVRAHHGRHAGDNMYLAEFTLTPKARRFEDYPEYVRELRERGFEVRRLEMSVRPDEIAGGPGDTIPMDFPGG